MVTEAVIAFFLKAILSIVGGFVNTGMELFHIPPVQFAIPSPFWFLFQNVSAVVVIIHPIAIAYWGWREFKA